MAKDQLASYGVALLLLVPPARGARVSGEKTSVTPEEIEQMLGLQAAPKVVAAPMREDETGRTALWDFVLGEIERGDRQWLKVAVAPFSRE